MGEIERMIKNDNYVTRKKVEEDRIAICPYFGCIHIERIKPLKLGFLGRRKYPKCATHKMPLVFVDEFIGNFIKSIEACLYDISSLPPKDLINLIKIKYPNNLKSFLNGWIYCNPIGRGGQIISHYMDGLSRGYLKVLSKKQRKALQNNEPTKKSYEILRLGLKKITQEYTDFLQNLRKKSEIFNTLEHLKPLSKDMRNLIQIWLKGYINTIKLPNYKKNDYPLIVDKSLSEIKKEYDKILHTGTCIVLLGKSPEIVTKGISAFEIFSAYYEFLEARLYKELKKEDIERITINEEKIGEKSPPNMNKLLDYQKNKNMSKENETITKQYDNFTIFNDISWTSRRKKILTEIRDFFLNNKNIFSETLEVNDFNIKLTNSIQLRANAYLSKNVKFMNEFTQNQQEKVNKYIVAIFLMTRKPPFVRNKISELSKLNVGTINNIINLLNLDIPNNIRERSQIFNTLEENADFLRKILERGLREHLLLSPKQAPRKVDLISNSYEQFYYNIERKKTFTYSDVIRKAGLYPFTDERFTSYFLEKFCYSLIKYMENLKNNDKNGVILLKITRKETFDIIYSNSKIPTSNKYSSKSKICLIVISLAFLKCDNYTDLSNELQKITKKGERTVRRYITEFIPLISIVKGINVSKWMPRVYSDYSFKDIVKIVSSRGLNLLSPINEKEFEIMKAKSGVYKMRIKIHCGDPNHLEYQIRFDTILNGSKCKYCTGYTLTLAEIEEFVELVGLRKSGKAGILINPSNVIEFENLKSIHNTNPAIIPIQVKCGNPQHPPWTTQYHYIQQGYWCPLCGDRYVATGNCIHPIFEYLTLSHLWNQKCYAKNEYYVVSNHNFAVDIVILRDNNFIISIEKNQRNFPFLTPTIQLICIDFTLSTSFKALKTKFYKNYQSYDRLLIIVLLIQTANDKKIIKKLYEDLDILTDISNKHNIKFLTFDMFLEFIGLIPTMYNISPLSQKEKINFTNFKKYFKLMENALESDLKLGKLKIKSELYKKNLEFLKQKNKKYIL
jgi:hypothetical protein